MGTALVAHRLSAVCLDDEHGECKAEGWRAGMDPDAYCPCHCHDGVRCGQPHEAPGLAYLGPCVMGPNHEGPHEFDGPIDGTVISVTLGDGWTRTEDRPEHLLEPGLNDVLKDVARALAPPDSK